MNNSNRKSIRIYDENHHISNDEIESIILAANKAPSSMNMQPWRYVVIRSKEAKNLLEDALYGNKNQLNTSSAMIVIFNDLNKYSLADKIYTLAYEKGLMPLEVKTKQLSNINKIMQSKNKEKMIRSGLIDCGIAAMNLMNVARDYGYDTCPIGGFNHDKIHDVCNLDKERYYPVMIVSIGKAAEKGYESIRLSFDDVAKII